MDETCFLQKKYEFHQFLKKDRRKFAVSGKWGNFVSAYARDQCGMKEFFVMTRRERRGTIVVLLLISLLLISIVTVRSCKTEVPVEAQEAAMVQFEKEIDSVRMTENVNSKKPRAIRHKAKKKKKPSPGPAKSSPAPRRMDPVPQF